MLGFRMHGTRDDLCAFVPQKLFPERGRRARRTYQRGGARQNRAASTLAVKPAHASREPPAPRACAPPCQLCHYDVPPSLLLLCCQTQSRSAGAGSRFLIRSNDVGNHILGIECYVVMSEDAVRCAPTTVCTQYDIQTKQMLTLPRYCRYC